ncbi:hypothetical protein KXQ82_08380 [Mucilaginibacter sp. HMF5004]|uniref:hypothetical protein n=1 Tax=Mucilaginibacter rivuli TaxID=2857527 RepID=UPI001C5D8414|nr:hypothetical protein [Mucilaginibacter rivuli]MBW4889730.1 hypothetical protein [Mucilaginibacter rivuli]
MKTILIPTDFKPESLNCIAELVKKVYPEKLNIIMVHLLKITDSEQELLMLARRSTEYNYISPGFYKAYVQAKNNYADRINKISIEFFFGSTVAAFRNFLDAHQVDSIVLLDDYQYESISKDSVDPLAFINRSKTHVIHLNCNPAIQYTLPKLKPSAVPADLELSNSIG